MRKQNFVVLTVIAVLGAAGPALGQRVAKAPADTLYPATLTFSNRLGDAITSDGAGPYTNGGRTELGFHSVTNDLVMRGDSGTRYVRFDSTNQVTATGPEGVTNEFDVVLNVFGILDMVPGETRLANARVSGFRFNPTNFAGTTRVEVYRDASGAWIITADTPGVTDIAALTQVVKGKEKVAGLYHMPFQVTVVCPTCS